MKYLILLSDGSKWGPGCEHGGGGGIGRQTGSHRSVLEPAVQEAMLPTDPGSLRMGIREYCVHTVDKSRQ